MSQVSELITNHKLKNTEEWGAKKGLSIDSPLIIIDVVFS